MHDDVTKPKRDDVFPPDYDIQDDIADDEDSGLGGPGCLAWGFMLFFGLIVAVGIVITATFAGFNSGLNTARVTAAAATNANIVRQCTILPTDIAAGRLQVVESRYQSLTVDGQLPSCAQNYVVQATDAALIALITPTVPATPLPEITQAPTLVPENTAVVAADDDGYDLDNLLLEAQNFMSLGDYDDAISTLDAIIAIDDTFQSQAVNTMLFSALTQRALFLFRSENGSLAEGILLTNRAETYGNIQTTDLPFERSVAELYLDAQANLSVNYPLAISLLNQVIALSPNYPRGSGQASATLIRQYEAYGDALLISGEACSAQSQFDAALSYRPNNVELQNKQTTAETQCQLGVVATPDPNATLDPNAPPATATVAPVGQTGGN